MRAIAQKVNQQLSFAQLLLGIVQQDGSVKDTALLQACYINMELALLFYVDELLHMNVADPKDYRGCAHNSIASAVASLPKTVAGAQELGELINLDGSWLNVCFRRLCLIRSPILPLGGKGQSGSNIFATVEPNVADSGRLLITAENISFEDEGLSFDEISHILRSFQKMMSRQRANNEEY